MFYVSLYDNVECRFLSLKLNCGMKFESMDLILTIQTYSEPTRLWTLNILRFGFRNLWILSV